MSNKDIQKAFTKSGYTKLQKFAKNADYVGFVYSLFGVTDQTYSFITEYDKKRVNEIAAELTKARQYYLEIKNERYSD